MSKHLPPVTVCARLFGGIEALAQITGNKSKAGYNWRYPTMNHDAGDFRSARHMRAVLRAARELGVPLTAEHLLHGVSAEELARLEACLPVPDPGAQPLRVEAAE